MPELETERLVLRRMRLVDAEDMYEYARQTEVTRYLLWSPHPDISHTQDYLRYIASRYATGSFYDWAMVLKKNGKMIGTCGFTRFDFRHDCGEIGYVINPAYQGQGIATEAVARVIRFGFENLGLNRIECKYMPDNIASRRVMEKNRMVFEGIRRQGMLIKGEYRDVAICSILKEEFFK
jgi:ribosomal-protein-alanine N-acetyltransferase